MQSSFISFYFPFICVSYLFVPRVSTIIHIFENFTFFFKMTYPIEFGMQNNLKSSTNQFTLKFLQFVSCYTFQSIKLISNFSKFFVISLPHNTNTAPLSCLVSSSRVFQVFVMVQTSSSHEKNIHESLTFCVVVFIEFNVNI
jgi:hypothetical protein